ncbi:MAG: hypothetical protein H7Z41_19615, partial [Cytophagales bacterium]|nr:hypothetical protein [Armatimonadota bacterium]
IARAAFGLPYRIGKSVQPWIDTKPAARAGWRLGLRFILHSSVAVAAPLPALEDPESVTITLFPAGTHEIVLRIPMTRRTDIEWAYLLGDFGVEVRGSHARLTAPVRELAFGDWTRQGLPFYAGNVTYHCAVEGSGERATHRGVLDTPTQY